MQNRGEYGTIKSYVSGGLAMKYDVIIVGAGPGGIFAAYELMQSDKSLKVAICWSRGNVQSTERRLRVVSDAKAVLL